MSKARIEAPEDFQRYQRAGRAIASRPIFKAGPPNEAVKIIEQIVRAIHRDNPKMTRTAAMAEARRKYPMKWAGYQAA